MGIIEEAIELLNMTNPGFLETLPPDKRAKVISNHASNLMEEEREEKEKEEKEAQEASAAADLKKAQRLAKRNKIEFNKWNNVITKAYGYYADICYEYCSMGNDDSIESIHARLEMGDFDDKACKKEALIASHPGMDPDWYDNAVRYWKKRGF